jgi:Holliday junction DNA helicase RuvA
VKIYTSFQVREDAMTLYGFTSAQDRAMFEQLLGISGVGPKAAMGILSTLKPDDLRMAIISEDAKSIARAPGIGPKTAKRVILELKDKIRMEDILPGGDTGIGSDMVTQLEDMAGTGAQGAAKEAIEALVALGYSLSEATRAVRQVALTDEMDAEAVLKASLKHLIF